MTVNVQELKATEATSSGYASSLEETIEKIGIKSIPYKTTLCFDRLIQTIEDKALNGDVGEKAFAQLVISELEKAADLRGPIDDCQLANHQDTLELLMLAIMPTALRDTQLAKVSAPLSVKPLYETPATKKIFENFELNFRFSCPTEAAYNMMVTNAGSAILNKFYGQNINIESPVQVIQKDPETGLSKYYKTAMNFDFVEIKKLRPLKPLSKEQISKMLGDIYNIKLWLEYLPPENFEFQGFVIGNFIDITEEETLSRIRFGLLEKNAVANEKNIAALEKLVGNYLNLPDIKLGIRALDYPIENTVAHKYKIHFNFLADKYNNLLENRFTGSIYEKVCRFQEGMLIEDLEKLKRKTALEEALITRGLRSILIAPMINQEDKVIGILEIGSKSAAAINGFIEYKSKEIISLFNLAIERSREEIDNQIEAVIREKYTVVHPSVEWKFIQSSYNYLEKMERKEPNASVDPIVFEDVFPLYGQADIVGSSNLRNNAIRADLITNLNFAHELLKKAVIVAQYPLVDQYMMKVEKNLENLKQIFNSNDEARLLEFFFEEVHPLFHQLSEQYPELVVEVKRYFSKIDKDLGIVYEERKAYEDSVMMLNNAMSNHIEKEERKSQKVIPHYFEKYKTDGVEYDIYVGQSLLNKGLFNMMHLKNLRLWQLINMVEVTRIVQEMQEKLPIPLTTAQLIFVYGSTLSIRFRMDEKQFDVDGAYNVRYEILKKRIDKALIDGTDERLTQSGKIAIVYLQEKDRIEYLDYLHYLQQRGYIEEKIEDVTLGKLQGVQGLRALRVTVRC